MSEEADDVGREECAVRVRVGWGEGEGVWVCGGGVEDAEGCCYGWDVVVVLQKHESVLKMIFGKESTYCCADYKRRRSKCRVRG